MENILVVANPTSGEKAGLEFSEKLMTILDEKGLNTELYETTGDDNFKSLVQKSVEAGVDTVAVLGGDGTISEFTAQISDLEKRPEVLLIPLGTTNNFAQALNTELDMDLLINKIENDDLVKKQADIGRLDNQYFVSTLSAGSLPEIAWKTDEDVKEMFGSFGYILEGITSISEDETFDLAIQTEIEEITLEDVALMVVGLSNSVFGIPTFFEDGDIDDGKVYLYALKTSNLMEEGASLAHHIFPGNGESEEKNDELSYVTSFEKAKIKSSTELNLTIDGEKGPTFPIELDVLHKHLTFLVPEADNE